MKKLNFKPYERVFSADEKEIISLEKAPEKPEFIFTNKNDFFSPSEKRDRSRMNCTIDTPSFDTRPSKQTMAKQVYS
jgi:hypothetical protein